MDGSFAIQSSHEGNLRDHATRPLRESVPNTGRRVEEVFTPSTPVTDPAAFAGRTGPLELLVPALGSRGPHAVLFGERGAGKTSLVQVAAALVHGPLTFACVATDDADTFTTLWQRAFEALRGNTRLPAAAAQQPVTPASAVEALRTAVSEVPLAIAFDDFERADPRVRTSMVETLVLLTGAFLPVTLLFCGTAESAADLLPSEGLERGRIAVPVRRMREDECYELLLRGLEQLGLSADDDVIERAAMLTLGMPRHLQALGQALASVARREGVRRLVATHLEAAVREAVAEAPASVQEAYQQATVRARRGIFPEILLACALTPHDETGSFTVADARATLQRIVRREVRGLTNQVAALTEEGRGAVVVKKGLAASARYRFADPQIEPYVLMRGLEAGWTTGSTPVELPGLAAELAELRKAA